MTLRLDMIGIVTKDIAASLKFYRELGLDAPETFEGPYCEMTLEGGIRLSWNDVEMAKSLGGYVEPRGQPIGLAFLCDGPADVDSRYRYLIQAGYPSEKEPFDAFWGQRYAQVRDPDGNVVDLFAPLP